ncbi:branched-chain amino acid ABC transporter permease [Raineyella fluvialis]|uniref:Branched-chain amino acid ABC transporter permease n=1 Tax=Raineyella fluvialis TaxID=2662261 RepID=A0A5Q2FEP6_9ACTN|nr:branched-chain amino acid ABC transporter permease [Raineyella fluvialis]
MASPLTSPAVRLGLSVSAATGLYGISFGALSVASGLSLLQTCALSVLMFTGGSQFAFIGTIAGGGAGGTAALAATLLGVRNAVYGVSMNALLRPRGWRRYVAAQVTIDESTAVGSSRSDPGETRRGFWTAGVGVFVLWNAFTLVGALIGSSLGDPRAWGLDGAAVAAFLGLLWPRLRTREAGSIAVVCGLATAVATPFVPAGIPILVAAVVAVLWSLWGPGRPRGAKEERR